MNENADDRRVKKTKKALRQGLAALMLRKNIKDISVRELTDFVDLHRGTFYVHYRDIYDLYAQVEKEIIDEINHILDNFPPAKFQGTPYPMILAMVDYMAENEDMCRMMFGENGDMTFVGQVGNILWQKSLTNWMALHRNCDPERYNYFGCYVISGSIGVLRRWIGTDMRQTPAQIAGMIVQMGIQGVGFLSPAESG